MLSLAPEAGLLDVLRSEHLQKPSSANSGGELERAALGPGRATVSQRSSMVSHSGDLLIDFSFLSPHPLPVSLPPSLKVLPKPTRNREASGEDQP